MPSQEKKSWAKLKVGLLATVSLIIFAVLVFVLTSSHGLFKSRTDLYVFLDDSAAVALGSPVRLNGIDVGRISAVNLTGSTEPNRIVKITLQVDDEFLKSIPVDSRALVAAENLLGTKYINIKKGRDVATVQKGAELKSLDTREFDDVVQQGYSALSSLDGILKKVDGIVDSIQVGKGTIGKLLVDDQLYTRAMNIAGEVQKLTETMNSDKGTLGKLMHDEQLYDDVRGTITRVNSLVDGLQRGEGSAGKLLKDPALYDDTRATLADVRKVIAGINNGEGDVGKLLHSDEIHQQLKATMGRLDMILDKVNSGQGTLGQLLVNPSLYETLDGTTKEMNGLMKDFRANPKKFLRIQLKLF
jgi:phospholipid/cholesterol/gamma-HCH transport system substrate-binding protein